MASPDEVIGSIWTTYDYDASGTLDENESEALYNQIVVNRPDLAVEGGFHAWFKSIDGDDDHTISKEELKGWVVAHNYTHTHHK